MVSRDSDTDEAGRIRKRLAQLATERDALEARLAKVEPKVPVEIDGGPHAARVSNRSPATEKIVLFRSLFCGRDDVYPKRWESHRTGKSGYAPVCANEWKPQLCDKPRIRCGTCPNQAFLAFADEAIDAHLRGRETLGVYPLLPDDTCRFLAVDFDKSTWQTDAGTFLAACRSRQVPAALERSRSGNGAHVWIFFTEPVPASLARQLGSYLLSEAMDQNPDVGFDSYDRLFPSQDYLPGGGFGNLIALPLQGGPRKRGNSVFLSDDFAPYEDQWSFLSSLRRLTQAKITEIIDAANRQGRIIGLHLPLDDNDEEPWTSPPSRRRFAPPITEQLPEQIEAVISDQLYVPRANLPPGLVNRLIRLAAFQNPEFYRAQAMRRSTFRIPRIIACAELLSHHVALPRGHRDATRRLLNDLGIGWICATSVIGAIPSMLPFSVN